MIICCRSLHPTLLQHNSILYYTVAEMHIFLSEVNLVDCQVDHVYSIQSIDNDRNRFRCILNLTSGGNIFNDFPENQLPKFHPSQPTIGVLRPL